MAEIVLDRVTRSCSPVAAIAVHDVETTIGDGGLGTVAHGCCMLGVHDPEARPNGHRAARVDPRTSARVGQTVRLALDPSRLYFFAPETGVSLLGRAA
jgi:hypothetical protein